MALDRRIATDTATGGVLQGDNTLKTLAQQNTQNAVTQSTDTATGTPGTAPTAMIGSQGRQIVNIPQITTPTTIQETPATGIKADDKVIPLPQFPIPDAPVIEKETYKQPTQTTNPAPVGAASGALTGITAQPQVNGPAVGAAIGGTLAKPALSTTSGTGGTGGSGGGTGGTGGTPAGTTGTTGTTGTETTQKNAWQAYFDQAATMKFDWNSANDPAYLQEASNVEQQVTDMMVGRGGLYSSVYQSALQSRLMSLQIDMRQQRYSEFLEERNWVMNQAEFVADRSDTAYAQQMQMLNYQLELENQKFNQSMQRAELALAQSKFAYSKQQAALAEEAVTSNNTGTELMAQYTEYQSMLDEYTKRWQKTRYPDAEVQAFFGITDPSMSYYSSTAQSTISNKANQVSAYEEAAVSWITKAGDIEDAITLSQGVTYGTVADTTKMTWDTNYNQMKTKILLAMKSQDEAQEILGNLKADKSVVISYIGQTNYDSLVNTVSRAATKNQYAQ